MVAWYGCSGPYLGNRALPRAEAAGLIVFPLGPLHSPNTGVQWERLMITHDRTWLLLALHVASDYAAAAHKVSVQAQLSSLPSCPLVLLLGTGAASLSWLHSGCPGWLLTCGSSLDNWTVQFFILVSHILAVLRADSCLRAQNSLLALCSWAPLGCQGWGWNWGGLHARQESYSG